MRTIRHLAAAALVAMAGHSLPAATPAGQPSWPQWRGPAATGVAPAGNPPVEWSESRNVRWKKPIPGFGTSTPIIWGDKVFLLTAIPAGSGATPALQEFVVLCLERQSGKTLWQKVARKEVPHEGHHKDHGYASASPITDGESLIVHFGSRGTYAYDLDGNLRWEKDLGDQRTRNGFGEGSSPALHDGKVVILWDHEGEDFIVALDQRTGRELWRQVRDEPTGWSTPLVVTHGGKAQVVVNGTNRVRSYALSTGELLWECTGQTVNAIPSPVADDTTVYVTSGFRGSALQAIQLGRTGNLSGTDALRWSHQRNTPYVPSPLLVDGLLYFAAGNNGILSCFDARTGKPHFEGERLPGIFGIYASPVAAQDRVYVLGREGTCLVLRKGPRLEILATNKLDDRTDASIAVVGDELFIRGHQHLYCIGRN